MPVGDRWPSTAAGRCVFTLLLWPFRYISIILDLCRLMKWLLRDGRPSICGPVVVFPWVDCNLTHGIQWWFWCEEIAFEQEISGFYSRYAHQSWKNVISIGAASMCLWKSFACLLRVLGWPHCMLLNMNSRQQFRNRMKKRWGGGLIHEIFNIRAVLLSTVASQTGDSIFERDAVRRVVINRPTANRKFRPEDQKKRRVCFLVEGFRLRCWLFFCRYHWYHVQPKLRCRTKTAKLLDEPEIDELVAQACPQIATAVAKWLCKFGTPAIGYRYTVDTRFEPYPDILAGESGPRCTWPHGAVRQNVFSSWKSAHTALAVKACLLGCKTATLNAQWHLLI